MDQILPKLPAQQKWLGRPMRNETLLIWNCWEKSEGHHSKQHQMASLREVVGSSRGSEDPEKCM